MFDICLVVAMVMFLMAIMHDPLSNTEWINDPNYPGSDPNDDFMFEDDK